MEVKQIEATLKVGQFHYLTIDSFKKKVNIDKRPRWIVFILDKYNL